MQPITINTNFTQVIPDGIMNAQRFHNWKYHQNKNQKLLKVPIDNKGTFKPFDDSDILIPLEKAINNYQEKGWGIGLSLKDGLFITHNDLTGYLWCIDFDGFAELNGSHVDDGVLELLDGFNSYTEMSPSGTGFKVFLLTDKKPTKKTKIHFSESSFAKDFPEVDKYRNRAVEVFSQNLFLAITGEPFTKNKYEKIRFINSEELDKLLEKLDTVAKSGGGIGLNSNAIPNLSAQTAQKNPNRLSIDSLQLVLSFINADDEQTWCDVVNAVARVYGEDGRTSFHLYSKQSEKYDEAECDERYDRAIKELASHPDGYGIKHLLDLAKTNPIWNNPVLHNEEDKYFNLPIESPASIQNWRQGITASQLANKTFAPLIWVVQDILPEGCYLLSSRPKVGKSWLSLQVSLAVALGESTLGKQVTKGKAVYLALEDNERRLKDRLQQLRPNGFNTDDLILHTRWPSFDQGGIDELIDLIKREQPKLVVIDTLAKVRPASRNNHVYENDYKTLAPLTALASAYRLCILIVTHNRKGNSENDALEQVSGSLGLTGAVDGALVIDGIRTDKQYKMSLIGRDIPNDDELAIERKPNGEWQILGNATQVFISEERKAILDLLYLKPEGLKPKEIADLLDKKQGAVRKLLLHMASNMQVVNDNGNYKHPNPIGNSSNCSGIGNLGNNGN